MTDIDPDVFKRSIDVLDQMGWGKGREICDDGSVCAVGALRVALGAVPMEVDTWGKRAPDLVLPCRDVEDRRTWLMASHAYREFLDEAVRDLGEEEINANGVESLPDRFSYVTEFNDHPTTRLDDIKAVFERAYEMAKESK